MGKVGVRKFTPYGEKLRDPRWQRRRLEMLQTTDFCCYECNDNTKTLNVHHKIYRKGREPWDYPDSELVVLCEDCHKEEHATRDAIAEMMAIMPSGDVATLEGFACGLALAGELESAYVKNYEHAHGIGKAFGLNAEQIMEVMDDGGRINFFTICAAVDRARTGQPQ